MGAKCRDEAKCTVGLAVPNRSHWIPRPSLFFFFFLHSPRASKPLMLGRGGPTILALLVLPHPKRRNLKVHFDFHIFRCIFKGTIPCITSLCIQVYRFSQLGVRACVCVLWWLYHVIFSILCLLSSHLWKFSGRPRLKNVMRSSL